MTRDMAGVRLDATSHPHIFDLILRYADDATLRALRATGKHVSERADRMLFRHIVVQPLPRLPLDGPSTPVIALRTPAGAHLPAVLEWTTDAPPSMWTPPSRLEERLAYTHIVDYVYTPVWHRAPGPLAYSWVGRIFLSSTAPRPAIHRLALAPGLPTQTCFDAPLVNSASKMLFITLRHPQRFPRVEPVALSADNLVIHITFDPADPLLCIGGLGIAPPSHHPESIVVHLDPTLALPSWAQQLGRYGRAFNRPDPEIQPYGWVAWCTTLLATYPDTAFTFVGAEALPVSALPVRLRHLSPSGGGNKRAWAAALSDLFGTLTTRLRARQREFIGPLLPRLSLAFLTRTAYAVQVGDARYTLETVPPRPCAW